MCVGRSGVGKGVDRGVGIQMHDSWEQLKGEVLKRDVRNIY